IASALSVHSRGARDSACKEIPDALVAQCLCSEKGQTWRLPRAYPRSARVLIVDDHPAIREALALRIARSSDLQVCGEASDLPEALNQMAQSLPDLAVVDLHLKTGSGLELIKRARHRYKSMRFLVCSMMSELLYADRALRAGAHGYITND